MQYLLSKEELDKLQQADPRFDKLTMIMHHIADQIMTDKQRLDLFRQLQSDLAYASQDGTIDAVLDAWKHRRNQLL